MGLRMRVVVVFVCLLVTSIIAQADRGRITGVITDTGGAVLPGVAVTLVHAETGLERTAMTGQDGRATASALAVGRYTMRAELDAFRPVTADDITIELGAAIEVRMTLYLASRAETIACWESHMGRAAAHVEFYEQLAGFHFTLVMIRLAAMMEIPEMAVRNPVAEITAQILGLPTP